MEIDIDVFKTMLINNIDMGYKSLGGIAIEKDREIWTNAIDKTFNNALSVISSLDKRIREPITKMIIKDNKISFQ